MRIDIVICPFRVSFVSVFCQFYVSLMCYNNYNRIIVSIRALENQGSFVFVTVQCGFSTSHALPGVKS